jgi:hypothetical protein
VLLFDIGSGYHRLNEWKADMWEKFGIPSPEQDKETNDAIVFGYLVAWFFGEVSTSFLPSFLPRTSPSLTQIIEITLF